MGKLEKAVALLALLALMLLPVSFAVAASNTVGTLLDEADDGECVVDCTLREAIALAGNGDTVDFAPGLAGGTITLTQGEITFNAGMTIDGSAAPGLQISGNNASRIFSIVSTPGGQPPTITDLMFIDGNVIDSGGAVFINNGFVNIINCTFDGNASSGAGSSGGAVAVYTTSGNSSVSIEKSTFVNNSNTGGMGGGAVAFVNDGMAGTAYLGILGSTLSGNSAPVAGAVLNSGGELEIVQSTISGTTSTGAGGAAVTTVDSGIFLAQNAIIANNVQGAGCNVTPSPQMNNIEDGTSCGWGGISGSLGNTAPLLGALGNYGGPTATMPLLPGSPAIDSGDGGTCTGWLDTTDQRGVGYDTFCDIGAFESQGFSLTRGSGSGQSAAVGAAFAAPLVVNVAATAPVEPVNGGVVTFSAPLSGAGLSFGGQTTQAVSGGTTSLSVTANTIAGTYAVSADARGSSGIDQDFTLTNTAAVSVTTIDAATPDPSYPGEAVTVVVTVTGLAPAGTVDITGADTNCSLTLAGGTGTCDVVFMTPGLRTLTATYGGDGVNLGGADTEAHEVFFPPGDSDHDGSADIFWRDPQRSITLVSYFIGTDYSGKFKMLQFPVPPPWEMAGAADFNQDGSPDILWRNPVSGINVIAHYQNNVLRNLRLIPGQGPEWRVFGTGDSNKDRYPDIFWYNAQTRANEVWYMKDKTLIEAVDLPRAPAPWVPLAVADFNNDTNPDVVARSGITGRVIIAFLSATNLQGTAKLPVASTGWEACGTVDLSGDFMPDLVWRDPVTGADEAWIIENSARTSTVALPVVMPGWNCMAGHK